MFPPLTYPRHHTIDPYLAKVRAHSEPYIAMVHGLELLVVPGVMSPKYDRSSRIFVSMLESQNGKRFLDVGTGCGVVGVFAGRAGAKVSAVDINPSAVANARANFRRHGLDDTRVVCSDLFARVDGPFDTIFFNAPFHGNEPRDLLERGVSDPGYQTLQRFLRESPRFLSRGGQAIVGLGSMSDLPLFQRLAREGGYRIAKQQSRPNGNWTALLFTLELVRQSSNAPT